MKRSVTRGLALVGVSAVAIAGAAGLVAQKAIAKGQPVVYPTAPAKIQSVMRRLTPGMLWKTITKIEEM